MCGICVDLESFAIFLEFIVFFNEIRWLEMLATIAINKIVKNYKNLENKNILSNIGVMPSKMFILTA